MPEPIRYYLFREDINSFHRFDDKSLFWVSNPFDPTIMLTISTITRVLECRAWLLQTTGVFPFLRPNFSAEKYGFDNGAPISDLKLV